MKNVDRDFDAKKEGGFRWLFAYLFFVAGAIILVFRIWEEVHRQGMSFYSVIRIIGIPLIYVCPLIISFQFRKYVRSALVENLINERAANNCEHFIGYELFLFGVLIVTLVIWN